MDAFQSSAGTVVAALVGHTVVTQFRGATSAAEVRELTSWYEMLLDAIDDFVMVTRVVNGEMTLEDDARAAVIELLNTVGERNLAGAVVFEVAGMKGVAVRAIVAMLLLASRSACPRKVFGNVDEALAWTSTLHQALVDGPGARAQIAQWDQGV